MMMTEKLDCNTCYNNPTNYEINKSLEIKNEYLNSIKQDLNETDVILIVRGRVWK